MWRRCSLWRCEAKCEKDPCMCVWLHVLPHITAVFGHRPCACNFSTLTTLQHASCLFLCLASICSQSRYLSLLFCHPIHSQPCQPELSWASSVVCHCAATVPSVPPSQLRGLSPFGPAHLQPMQQPEPSFCRISKTPCTASLQNLSIQVSPGIRFCWSRT